jgi:hypothetical protein
MFGYDVLEALLYAGCRRTVVGVGPELLAGSHSACGWCPSHRPVPETGHNQVGLARHWEALACDVYMTHVHILVYPTATTSLFMNLKSRPNDILTLPEAASTSQNILRNRARYRSNVNFIPTVSALPSFGHGICTIFIHGYFPRQQTAKMQREPSRDVPQLSH